MRRIFAAFLIVALVVGISIFAAADEDRVYIATLSGAKFHIDRDCWGLDNAINVLDVNKDHAYSHGYTPCKICSSDLISVSDLFAVSPSSADGVLIEDDKAYYAPDGKLYHDKPDCVNLWYADKVGYDAANGCAEYGMQHCPLCVQVYPEKEFSTETIVFFDPDDKRYHKTPECAYLVYGEHLDIIEAYKDDMKSPYMLCSHCFG